VSLEKTEGALEGVNDAKEIFENKTEGIPQSVTRS
jgi:hypothetical protein